MDFFSVGSITSFFSDNNITPIRSRFLLLCLNPGFFFFLLSFHLSLIPALFLSIRFDSIGFCHRHHKILFKLTTTTTKNKTPSCVIYRIIFFSLLSSSPPPQYIDRCNRSNTLLGAICIVLANIFRYWILIIMDFDSI